VWLASDEDREGEAIAWHLSEVLGLNRPTTQAHRVHEIHQGRMIVNDYEPIPRAQSTSNRVDAQQARRVLDRIVGFELSPVLWRKIKPSLSAGRVQSVAVRLIVEREEEIKRFKAEPYFRVTAEFTTAEGRKVNAELPRRLADEKTARELLERCAGAGFSVGGVTVKPLKKRRAAVHHVDAAAGGRAQAGLHGVADDDGGTTPI